MSYILDALLKADQERQRNTAPTLHSIHTAQTVHSAHTSRRWRYLLLLMLLGSSIAGAGMLFGWQALAMIRSADRPPPAAPVVATAPGSSAGQTVSATTMPLPAPGEKPPPAAGREPPVPVPAAKATLPAAISTESAAAPAQPQPQPAPAAGKTRTKPAPELLASLSATPKSDNRIIDITELPPPLREEVTANVVVSGFSYSADNNERLVIINDRVRRAGEDVLAGMKLETVQADGVILSYKGYRFRSGSY